MPLAYFLHTDCALLVDKTGKNPGTAPAETGEFGGAGNLLFIVS